MQQVVKRYDTSTDEMVEVDQEWVDAAQRAMNRLALRTEIMIKLGQVNVVTDWDKVEAIAKILELK